MVDFIPVSITIASVFLPPYPSPHSLSAVGYRCTHIPCTCPVSPRPVSGLHFTPPRHSHRSPRPTIYYIHTCLRSHTQDTIKGGCQGVPITLFFAHPKSVISHSSSTIAGHETFNNSSPYPFPNSYPCSCRSYSSSSPQTSRPERVRWVRETCPSLAGRSEWFT